MPAARTAIKGSGTVNGICEPIASGDDPQSECEATAPSTCGTKGACNGNAACELHAAGTACGLTSCSNGWQQGSSCNGFGDCLPTSNTACAPYVCSGSTCAAACSDDNDCIASYYCQGSQCLPDQANGAQCSAGSQCTSGSCANGVCCDTACAGTCQACTAARKFQGVDGVCGNIADAHDPDNECADQAASSCGLNGSCNGNGTCGFHVAGTACGTTSCANGQQTGYACNGLGSCLPDTSSLCSPYVCIGNACATQCTTDADCIPTWHCHSGGSCQADLAHGAPCTGASQCASGHCEDGVCCDTACAGMCQACTTEKKGTGSDGVCGNIVSTLDPDNECEDQGASSCGTNGFCNGMGTYANYPQGTACGTTTCQGDIQTGLACNGSGSCNPSSSKPCAPYKCNGTSCGTTCLDDTQCSAQYYCRLSDQSCQAAMANGEPCTSNGMCASNNCVDGFCCDTVCEGSCMACSAAKKGGGSNGACGAVAANSDPDHECAATNASTCGTNGYCNGQGGCAYFAQGTACGATSCSNAVQTGQACNGSGTCLDAQTTPCSPYFCAGSSCSTACIQDADCIASYYCDASSHSCLPDQNDGQACTGSAQCGSGYCIDGFCCDTACQGACTACSSMKKGQGSDGACGPIASNTDPDNECSDEGAASCQHNGFCSGAGACALYATGTACGVSACANGLQTGQACNGAGTCIDGQTVPCSPYPCSGAACAAKCFADAECIDSHHCRLSDNSCQPDQASGAPCTSGAQCTSGNCADSVCCDTACQGGCQACTAAKKGGGVDGVCGDVPDGQDPHDDCQADGAQSCGLDGMCNGAGECRFHAQGVSCGDSACQGNVAKGKVCNGQGSCITDTAGTDCAPFVCAGSGCANPCATSADCVAGHYCDQGTCKSEGVPGAACKSNAECKSGFCVDGYCCDNECSGQCQACDVAGSLGTCVLVSGAPHGTRPACGGQGSCASTCDGINPSECAFPGSAIECEATCVNGALSVSVCDGAGHCLAGPASSCAPYVCDNAKQCKTGCVADTDCTGSMACGEDNKCVPATPDAGAGGSAGSEGGTGGGGTSSDSGDDAATAPFVPSEADDSGGCGCRTSERSPSPWRAPVLLALAALILRRRRVRGAGDESPCPSQVQGGITQAQRPSSAQ